MKALAAKIDGEVGQKETEIVKMSRDASKGRLLVIDDDLGMQALLSDVLSSLGYAVASFSDPIGVLKILSSDGPKIDAIICDLNMPRISGLDFLDMLHKMGLKIPLILITAFGTEKIAQEAKRKGAFGYLSKPFQLSEIKELVQKAVKSTDPESLD